jgi:hypothetical protein
MSSLAPEYQKHNCYVTKCHRACAQWGSSCIIPCTWNPNIYLLPDQVDLLFSWSPLVWWWRVRLLVKKSDLEIKWETSCICRVGCHYATDFIVPIWGSFLLGQDEQFCLWWSKCRFPGDVSNAFSYCLVTSYFRLTLCSIFAKGLKQGMSILGLCFVWFSVTFLDQFNRKYFFLGLLSLYWHSCIRIWGNSVQGWGSLVICPLFASFVLFPSWCHHIVSFLLRVINLHIPFPCSLLLICCFFQALCSSTSITIFSIMVFLLIFHLSFTPNNGELLTFFGEFTESFCAVVQLFSFFLWVKGSTFVLCS